jgi:hypothetical protein
VNEKQIEAEHGQRSLDDDLHRAEPVLQLAAVEHELQRCEPKTERAEADPIEPQGRVATAIFEENDQPGDAEQAERQVDEEHPAPVVNVGEITAERRADHRSDHHADAPQRHGLAAFFQRIEIEHGGLRQRHQAGAERALQQTEQHHLVEAVGQPAQHGGDREAGKTADEQRLASIARRQPTDRRGHDRGGDDI